VRPRSRRRRGVVRRARWPPTYRLPRQPRADHHFHPPPTEHPPPARSASNDRPPRMDGRTTATKNDGGKRERGDDSVSRRAVFDLCVCVCVERIRWNDVGGDELGELRFAG